MCYYEVWLEGVVWKKNPPIQILGTGLLSYALHRLGSPEPKLQPEQRSAIESVYTEKDVFVWLPTGFGKSICYQTLPFVFDTNLGHKLDRHKWQALILDIVVLARKYARCSSSE